jgi:N-acylneuraminate cytidylyltransferase
MFAYIPARSGSKRILNKNIKLFKGKPIISYVIENIKKLDFIKSIYVSTDSKKIKRVAEQFGAKCGSLRKKSLADDKSGFMDLVKKDLPRFINLENNDNDVLFVLPTAILVSKKTFNFAYKKYKKFNCEVLMSCREFNQTPYWSMKINKLGNLRTIFPEKCLVNSQYIESLYYDSGLFYFLNFNKVKKYNDLKNAKKIKPFIVDDNSGIDVNTLDDWKKLESIFKSTK